MLSVGKALDYYTYRDRHEENSSNDGILAGNILVPVELH